MERLLCPLQNLGFRHSVWLLVITLLSVMVFSMWLVSNMGKHQVDKVRLAHNRKFLSFHLCQFALSDDEPERRLEWAFRCIGGVLEWTECEICHPWVLSSVARLFWANYLRHKYHVTSHSGMAITAGQHWLADGSEWEVHFTLPKWAGTTKIVSVLKYV